MKSFYEFSEMMNENSQAIDEGLFKSLGGLADKGAGMAFRGANAGISGLGQGVMQGVKRGFEVAKHGNSKNQIAGMRSKMEKAINSGDPKQFAMVAKEIHAELKAMKASLRKGSAERDSAVSAMRSSDARNQNRSVAANITPQQQPKRVQGFAAGR